MDGVALAITLVLVVLPALIILIWMISAITSWCARRPNNNDVGATLGSQLTQTMPNFKQVVLTDSVSLTVTMDRFLLDMEREKPIRFSSQQLRIATDNFTYFLGSGGFGTVYKGLLSNGVPVAVKILKGSSDKKIEEQFMAEVSTMGRTHHLNLVRLFGFCFEKNLQALVYEYMVNGSLDTLLFHEKKIIEFEKLQEIAVGTAKGMAYLHEECQQRIIHYDVKPGNILLDARFTPKVADFGLAKLYNRDNTHVTMAGGRGTPGYAAPEMWAPFGVTCKCDVFSFGMLLFEIIGRRRNVDTNMSESQEWLPKWIYDKFDKGETAELMASCGIEEKDWEKAERMVKVALWCVQFQPVSRPWMSNVVKMLEGGVNIEKPNNPFQHLVEGGPPNQVNSSTFKESGGFNSSSSFLNDTPTMSKYQIQMASS